MLFFSRLKSLFIPAIIITIFFSCNAADKRSIEKSASAFDLKQAEASIAQSNQNFMKSFKAGDSLGVANSYTTDAKTMGANRPAIIGRANIEHFISETMKKGIKTYDLSTTKVWGDSSIVAEEGIYNVSDSSNKQVDKGKYIVLWKPEAGNWKMFRDIWTTNLAIDTLNTKANEKRVTNVKH